MVVKETLKLFAPTTAYVESRVNEALLTAGLVRTQHHIRPTCIQNIYYHVYTCMHFIYD